MHWACRRGYLDVAALLLKHGADKNIRNTVGESPVSLCSNPQILQLLGMSTDPQRVLVEPSVHGGVDSRLSRAKKVSLHHDDLVLKVRVAYSPDPDFIEVELPQNDLTYQALVRVCCQELNLGKDQIVKLRKLPNTKLRKDEDIQRLENFQEIEVVANSVVGGYRQKANSNGIPSGISSLPTNEYQSISKKDQTILY